MSAPPRWLDALADLDLPALIIDLDAFDTNSSTVAERVSRGLTIRLASKSLRCRALLERAMASWGPRALGLLTYSPAETLFLAEQGFSDLLLAYPVARAPEAERVAAAAKLTTVRVAVDSPAQLAVLDEAARRAGLGELRVTVDVDLSLRALGGRVHLGVRRSPIRTPEDAVVLAQAAARSRHLRVDSVLAYEAQVAGVPDAGPSWTKNAALPAIKRRSVRLACERRAAVVAALREAGCSIGLVNGGGSGSLASTSADPAVTEVSAGSALFAPHLFDGYSGLPLAPATFIALAVTRSSDAGFATLSGGGFIASGAPGADRLPVLFWPAGLSASALEGFGEVQTPICGSPAPKIGDVVLLRPAKAGETAERFHEIVLVRGSQITGRVPTYRGDGRCFG